jgi:hypothetical protein
MAICVFATIPSIVSINLTYENRAGTAWDEIGRKAAAIPAGCRKLAAECFSRWRAHPDVCHSAHSAESPHFILAIVFGLALWSLVNIARPSGIASGDLLQVYCTQNRWRKRRDSNPRYPFRYASFQDWSHQPLGHSSVITMVNHLHGITAPLEDLIRGSRALKYPALLSS